MKIVSLISSVMAMAGLLAATPTVTTVAAQQRLNGKVDIVVTFNGASSDVAKSKCSFTAMNSATQAAIAIKSVTEVGSAPVAVGTDQATWTRSYVWNATADLGEVKIDDVAINVEATMSSGGVQLWADGPYWAECNVGASNPEEYGYYFWWGDTVGYKRNASNSDWVSSWDGSTFRFEEDACATYDLSIYSLSVLGYIDSNGNLTAEYDAATAHLGAPWRMPTASEVEALTSNCTTTWTTRNGVHGRLVTGKGAYASKSIFLPAGGGGDGDELCKPGSRGNYWTSTVSWEESGDAQTIWFKSGNSSDDFSLEEGEDVNYGMTVRPLRESAETIALGCASTQIALDTTKTEQPSGESPELFADPASTAFAGNATYNGWVRTNGQIAGLLTIKAAKAAKDGKSKLTISYVPLGGKKQNIKLDKSAMPAVGGNPVVTIPGLGSVKFGADSLDGVDVDIQAGADLSKSTDKSVKSAYAAKLASKDGVWTFAFATEVGYAAFSVTVNKKGKGKLVGTLPDGTKVSLSSQGTYGDRALAIPFAFSKKSSFGCVFWVFDDGTVVLSDVTSIKTSTGSTMAVVNQIAPSAVRTLGDGEAMLSFGNIEQAFTVKSGKWVFPKSQPKLGAEDPNPNGVKITITAKTGLAKGKLTISNSNGKKVKYTVNGVVVGEMFYGSASAKGVESIEVTAASVMMK